MGLEQLSDQDLISLKGGNLSAVSDDGLRALKGDSQGPSAAPSGVEGNDAGEGAAFVYGANKMVPFGNKITSGIGAVGAKALGADGSISNLYDQAQADAKATAEANPKSTFAGEAAGFATSLPILKAGGEAINAAAAPAIDSMSGLAQGGQYAKLLPQATKAGQIGLRAVQGAAMAAPLGAAYGAGDAEPGQAVEGAKSGAEFSAALGAGASVLHDAYSLLKPLAADVPSANELKKKASDLYQSAAQKGGVLSSDFTNKFISEVQGLKPQTEEGKIIAGDSAFTQLVDRVSALKDRPISLQAAQEIDEALGDAIDANTDMGRITKQGVKILDVQSTLRNMISDAAPDSVTGGKEGFDALSQARKAWSQSRKMSDIERIINRASNMEQPATGIKSGFRTMLANPARMRGFTEDEATAIKEAATSGNAMDVLRMAGSRLAPIVAAASGGGLPATVAATAISTASRNAASKLQIGKAVNISNIIANGGKAPVKELGPSLAGKLTGRGLTPAQISRLSPKDAMEYLKTNK